MKRPKNSILNIAKFLIKELNKFVVALLIIGPIFGIFQGLLERKLALLLRGDLFNSNGVQIGKFLIIYLTGSFMKLLATTLINFGSSLSGSLFANKLAKSILYMPNFNRGSESKDLTLVTRNIDYLVNRFFNPFTTFIYATINALIYIYTIFILILSSNTIEFINLEKIIISLIISLTGIFVIKKAYRISKYLGEIYQKLLYNSTLIAKDLVSISKETRLYKNTKNLLIRHKKNERKLRLIEASITSLPLVNSLSLEFVIGLILIILLATSKITGEFAGIGFLVTRLLPSINQIIRSFLRMTNSIPLFNDLINRVDEFNSEFSSRKELKVSQSVMKGEKYLTNRFIPLEISIKNYSINLNDKKISYPDCVFSKGDINLIIGKSGSGKTTFIESLLGVNKTNDIVSLNYQYLSTEKETKKVITRNLNQSLLDGIFGYCPQISSILSEDIWSNIYLGTNIHRELIRKNLFFKSLVTPDMLKEKNCQLLSGGEQKRVSILRCLLSTKEVLIFDEPTNGLNKHYRNEIIKIMKKVSNDRMVIVISHDPDFINTFKPVLIL